MNKEEKKKCPKCGAIINLYPAISRRDNKTEICSDCGVIEAMEDYINYKKYNDKKEVKQNEK